MFNLPVEDGMKYNFISVCSYLCQIKIMIDEWVVDCFFLFFFWGQWWIGLVVVEGAATDKFRLALDTAPVLLRISFLVLHNWMLPKTRWWCRSRGANWLFSFFCEGVCFCRAAAVRLVAAGRVAAACCWTLAAARLLLAARCCCCIHQPNGVIFQCTSKLKIAGCFRKDPALLSDDRFLACSRCHALVSEAVFSFLPLPCKCKKKKNCDEILLIWSTKWSLFTNFFAQMGCKSRYESNDAN